MPPRSEDEGDEVDDEYRTEDDENVDKTEDAEDGTEDDAEAQTEEEPERRSTRQSRKRRATVSPPAAPPGAKKRGLGRPKGTKNTPKAIAHDTAEAGKEAAKEKKLSKAKVKSMNELRRAQLTALTYDTPITLARMEACVGPDVANFDATWTRADERAIGYHESTEKGDICALDISRHDPQLLLLKYCLAVCQRSPFDILSPRRGLCYVPSKEASSTVVWSKEFCRHLTDILSHRIWNGDIGALVLILQYAVICRTDDRRLWQVPSTRFQRSPTDLLRTELQASTAPLQTSIHEFHEDIRANRSPDIIHCQLSNLMMKISDVAAMRAESGNNTRWYKTKKNHDGYEVYGVTLADLSIIKEAIVRSTGASTEASFDAYTTVNPLPRGIVSTTQFRSFMRRAWLQEKRLIDIDKGLNGRSGTRAPRFAVAPPTSTNSRRDESEEAHDAAHVEIQPGSEGCATGLNNSNEQGYVGGGEGFDGGDYNFDDRPQNLVQHGDLDMGGGPEIRKSSGLPEKQPSASESNPLAQVDDEMLFEPSFIDTLPSRPARASGHEEAHRSYDPDHPLPSAQEVLGSAPVDPVVAERQPLLVPPLNSVRAGVFHAGFPNPVIRYRKDKTERVEKDLEVIGRVLNNQ